MKNTNEAPVTNAKKPIPPRTRYFSCVMYDDPATFEISNILHEVFRAIAYIKHDKDVLEDGSPKPVHWHVLGITPEKHTAKTITYALAHLPQNIMTEACLNRQGAWDYLTHKRNPDKAQYDKSMIYYEAECKARFVGLKGDNEEFLEDLQTLSMRDLAITYGRDVMRNYKSYKEFIRAMHVEMQDNAYPHSFYTYDPAEREAINKEREFIAYRLTESGQKLFVSASDDSVRKTIALALDRNVWNEYDRLMVSKRKTTSFGEYAQVFDMAYVEAVTMFKE